MLAEGWPLKAALRRLGQATLGWQGQPALAGPFLLHKGPRCGDWPPLLPAGSSSRRRLLRRTSKRLLVRRTPERRLMPSRLPLGHARLRPTMLLPGCAIMLCRVQLSLLVYSKGVALLGLEAVLMDPSRRLLACGRLSPACMREVFDQNFLV